MPRPEVEQAVAFYHQGYTCAQSILASFAGRYAIPQSLAFKLGEPFGAGMSCTGGMCGSVTGSIMVLGLQYGSSFSNDDAARAYTYQLVQELVGRFTKMHGSIQCPDLLGYDLSDPQQFRAVFEKGMFSQLCPSLVGDAAQIVADLLEEAPPAKPDPAG